MRTKAAAMAVIASLTLLACSKSSSSGDSPEATPGAVAKCPVPAQGSRFSLCGTLAAARPGGTTPDGVRLIGTLESMPEVSGEHFTVKGGTLNAIR